MRKLIVVFLALAMVVGAFLAISSSVAAAGPKGGYADELVFFEQLNTQQAVSDVSAGNMQLYMFNLRNLADIQAAIADPNIKTVITPGSVDDLFINPVQHSTATGGYNPFAIKEVREAMHWLIDRNKIVEQIFGGYALPYTSPYHPAQPDYVRDVVFYQNLDRQYGYDPVKARSVVFAALSAVPGMTFDNGKWSYQGSLLTVTFIIRTEDRRKDIGNYVADQVESLGITVNRQYKVALDAFNIVYFGPPDIGAWEVYTEGFGFTALTAWGDNFIATLGWTRDSGDAVWDFYTPSATLVDSAIRLERGQYKDYNERLQLMRTAGVEAMKDPVRLMLVAEEAVFISSANPAKKICGYVYDLSGGPWTLLSSRTMRYCAPTTPNTMKIGQPVHWNSQWNPYRGFTWLYDETQRRALTDFGVYYHPHLGTFMPIRETFDVVTSGGYSFPPLSVPADAKWFNVSTMAFENVPAATTAVSKITFNYTFGKWHDGADITMADVWMELSTAARRLNNTYYGGVINPITGQPFATGDLGNSDRRGASAAVVTFLSAFKGARQTGPATMEVYLDYWHLDGGEIANIGDIWPTVPWEVDDLMAKTVLDNATAYHSTTAQNQGRVLLDLIRGNSLPILATDLQTLKTANHVPPGMSGIIAPADATARWAALNTFSTTTTTVSGQIGYTGGNFYDSNGPYWLKTVDVANRQTVMDRFTSYVYDQDKWDSMLVPKVPAVSLGAISVAGGGTEVVPGLAATIPITTTLFGTPYDQVTLNYLITNPATGAVVFSGNPTRTGTGTWQISLSQNDTSTLAPGAYKVQAIGVGAEAAVAATDTKTFLAIPQTVWVERELEKAKAALAVDIGKAQDQAAAADARAAAAEAQSASLSTLVTISAAVAVIAIVIGAIAVIMTMRKGAGMRKPESPPREGEGGGEDL